MTKKVGLSRCDVRVLCKRGNNREDYILRWGKNNEI